MRHSIQRKPTEELQPMNIKTLACAAGAVSAALILSGCTAVGTQYPTITENANPLEYLYQYTLADEAGLFSPYNAMGYLGDKTKLDLTDYEDHTYIKSWWCSKTDEPSYHDEVVQVCEANGGKLKEDGWCVLAKDNKTPIFWCTSWVSNRLCSSTASIMTEGVFPKRGTDYTSPVWQNFVVKYKAAKIKQAEEDRRAAKARDKAAEEELAQRRLNKERLLKARKGQTVCRYTPLMMLGGGSISRGRLVRVNSSYIEIEYKNLDMQKKAVMTQPTDDWYVCKARR